MENQISMKKLIIILAMIAVIGFGSIHQAYSRDDIGVKFNGQPLQFDAQPYVKNGRTLVPFANILKAFGAKVTWDSESQIVMAKTSSGEVTLKIGENMAYVNSLPTPLDVPPEISAGRTFVPLSFISENLGAEVQWDGINRSISIVYNDKLYEIGQIGSYGGLSFQINEVKLATVGMINIKGKVSSDEDLAIDIVDEYGYNLSSYIMMVGESDGMQKFEATAYLPRCHNFVGKRLVIKKGYQNQKLIKIAEYNL